MSYQQDDAQETIFKECLFTRLEWYILGVEGRWGRGQVGLKYRWRQKIGRVEVVW